MKKNILFSALLFGALLSCKKKNFTEEPISPILPPTELGYSKLSVEENKKALEQNGLDFIKKIEALPNEKFITLINRLADLDFEMMSSTTLGRELQAIAISAKNKEAGNLLNAVTRAEVEESMALSEFYGIYNWDIKTGKWLHTPSTDQLEIHYPSTAASNSNDVVLRANYTASKVKAQLDGDHFELPATTNVSLSIAGKEELKLTGIYEYKEDASPTNINIKLNMGTFAFLVSATSDAKALNSKVWMSKDNIELFTVATTANLNESRPAVKNLENVEEIIKDANTTIDIMNLRLIGQANIKVIQDAYNKENTLSQKEQRALQIETLNKNSKLYALYKDKNEVFAKNEFVMMERPGVEWFYDTVNNNWNTKAITYYELEPRLVFNDNSKMSLKAFFGNGFTKFLGDFETFTNKF
ncbi:hypothetical protein [Pedobacter gandavensis]|uniref:hypothetical protein n=1 Tax=Pedobacter gandavensis TaxID=2679963 RepID=UPI00292F994E|nr:hypothetical protein [Pedobacter gandavensis]